MGERSSLDILHRVLAWVKLLNDVNQIDSGYTFFSHGGLAVQPRKGITLIYLAEWTHPYKFNVLRAGDDHIITAWVNFP